MGGGTNLANLSPGENVSLGILAGMGSKMTNYPLLVLKNNTQQGLPVSFNPKILYRGLPMAMMNLGGTTGVQFVSTGFFQRMLAGGHSQTNVSEMGGSFLGGVFSGIPCCVWELTMIQQQRFGGSLLATPSRIIADHGVATLLRGVWMTSGRESLYTMAMLGITPFLQRTLVDNSGMNPTSALAVGALSGAFLSATLTHPMDTIKTCMQGDIAQEKYKGIRQTGQLLIQEYGYKGLFKGLGWRTALIATTFFLVNRIKGVIAPVIFPHAMDEE